jgi:hypothetical protein
VIYDRAAPGRSPRANTCWIGSVPPEGGWSARPAVAAPQIIDTETSHPLMQWTDLGDIRLLAEAAPLVVPRGGRVLVDSDAGPLVAVAGREGFDDVVLGFKIVEEQTGPDGKTARFLNTDWPLRVSFTSFVLNLLGSAGGSRDAAAMGSYRPGSTVPIELGDSRAEVEVQPPSGPAVRLAAGPGGKASFAATDDLGVYQVRVGGKAARQFAVSLADPAESDIRTATEPSIKVGYVEVAGKRDWRGGHLEIWKELLLLALAVLLVEWYTYLRRVS